MGKLKISRAGSSYAKPILYYPNYAAEFAPDNKVSCQFAMCNLPCAFQKQYLLDL